MTTTLQTNSQEKAHGKVGLSGILGDYPIAAIEAISDFTILAQNYQLLNPKSLLVINDRLTPIKGKYVGERLDTVETIGLVLHNKDYEPTSLLCLHANDHVKPIITDTSQPSAYLIGKLSDNSELIAVDNLNDGMALAKCLINEHVTIAISPTEWLINETVKHFSQDRPVTIFTTLDKVDEVSKPLAGYNVKVVVTSDRTVLEHMQYGGLSYAAILADRETTITNLQAEAWPDPKPIDHILPPVTSITSDMLPEPLYNYSINTAERLSVPIEFVAVPLVVALGSVIGTKVAIMPKRYDNWDIVPNLWGAIIGKPSSKKSPSITEAMKPIDNLVSKARADYELNKQEHETQRLINDSKAKIAEKELKKLADTLASQTDDDNGTDKVTDDDLRQKAAFIAESKKQDESIPIPRRHMVGDITIEKLGEIENQNNNGVLQFRDELSGFLASLEKDSEQEKRSFYLSGFNGTGSEMVDRIGRGSLFIENHCLSVMGGIQPDKLEMYLEQTMRGLGNDGLMQRFQMMVYPDPLPRRKEKDIAVDKESRDAVHELFITTDEMSEGKLVSYGANEPNEYYKRPYFRFADDAYKVFMDWYDALQAKADSTEHEVIAQHLLKYGRLIPALALIFHLVDCIEIGSRLGGVSLDALKAAIAWGDMLETHMLRVYSCITDNSHLKASLLANKILALLKKPSDKTDKTDWISHGFTARSLKRKNWKGLTDDKAVQTALDVLIEYDWLKYETVESTGQGGRPTERYWINPKLKTFI